eukprot:TRINITY_DN6319_c0_g1_i2.p1 TRINITY_DN6319_c0_g1~~TRINITY_DN6319_c0_g1_i2.p1  ORF type:complete len:244 (+),score=43.93 TRINITY_DN6319_c0_g1_i2:48-779(+)
MYTARALALATVVAAAAAFNNQPGYPSTCEEFIKRATPAGAPPYVGEQKSYIMPPKSLAGVFEDNPMNLRESMWGWDEAPLPSVWKVQFGLDGAGSTTDGVVTRDVLVLHDAAGPYVRLSVTEANPKTEYWTGSWIAVEFREEDGRWTTAALPRPPDEAGRPTAGAFAPASDGSAPPEIALVFTTTNVDVYMYTSGPRALFSRGYVDDQGDRTITGVSGARGSAFAATADASWSVTGMQCLPE